MKLLEVAYCQTPDQFWQGNGQNIREAILRAAVKYCDHYATDVLILFEGHSLRDFTKFVYSDKFDIMFRDYGVDWGDEFTDTNYRYHMQLVKRGEKYELYGEIYP